MLAAADLATAVLVSVSIGLISGSLSQGLWAAVAIPVWLIAAKLLGLYDRDHRAIRHLTVDEFPMLALWGATGVATTSVVLAFTPAGSVTTSEAVAAWCVAIGCSTLLRGLVRMIWRRVTAAERTLIIGEGPAADAVHRKLDLFPDIHVEVVGQWPSVEATDIATAADELARIDRIVVASATIDEELIAELANRCRPDEIKLSVIPPQGMFGTAVRLYRIADLPVIEYNTADVSQSTMLLKRMLDIGFAGVALILLAPVLLVVAVAVRLDTKGPVIFSQLRAGLHGRPFWMLKFRTMVADAEERLADVVALDELSAPMFKLANDPRVTRVGRLLRRTSLDELPQLWNVLRGDMSLVGPRPEQLDLVDRYLPEHQFRLWVKPGMTGPMQVFGRGQLSFDERLAVEREYIENLSIGRDLRILALTAPVVFSRRGAY
jgi:exopolysaccharide biosynthesis polyprenyl glycosylphosphotransferase